MKTVKEIENAGYTFHHTSLCRGYQSVKEDKIVGYSGRFGKGYAVYSHNSSSTRFCYVSYYVKNN